MSDLIGGATFLVFYVYLVIPLAPIIYIFLKWRSYRDNSPPDPQLGMKVVLYYFKTLAYHACLASLAAILYGVLKSGSDLIKGGLGILVSCGILYVVHGFLILKLTNTGKFPLTARIYTAFNLIIVGLVGMISFVITFTTLIAKDLEQIELPLVCFVLYGIAWVFQTLLFCKPLTLKKRTPPTQGA
ncbi:MAG: hypothetical protein JSV88_19695 [Candidatus Aminicenantes bacterium]|nr:MAG: hypothetical protein JSV88_19695 [Candidatus Aminicenantes bacterium]